MGFRKTQINGLKRSSFFCFMAVSAVLIGAALLADTGKKPPEKLAQKSAPIAKSSPPTKKQPAPTKIAALPPVTPEVKPKIILLKDKWEQTFVFSAGKTVEISVHLEKPSNLPANGRIAVEWALVGEQKIDETTAKPEEIPHPTSGWRKILHALDGDIYMVYRAPVSGQYTLHINPVTDEPQVGDATPRWREKGSAPMLASLPAKTDWPAGTTAPIAVSVHPITFGDAAEQENLRTFVAVEPNGSPEQAQPITINPGNVDVRTWEITGGADDIEFFDNGRVGKSGEDWFRLDYKGIEPRMLTAQLSMPGQAVAARIRCYRLNVKPGETVKPGAVPTIEYLDGQSPNERDHQQDEKHRTNISRIFKPSDTYFLRVEANSPGYQLQLRALKPAPYTDPRMAVRQGIYQQIGQVDAWITNRPRGASVERRIRDSGNLLGTECMSCHTQSGVWGPAVPFANGYRLENVQNYWHLVNVMYECLRPTNVLKDAANNTSLAPLDIGDGPAGTRAAGFNIVNLEKIMKPDKLHSKQQIRTANFVLQTSDPGGINAAGPGSNVGQSIVYLFAGEILKTAWEKTGDPKYFRALEDRARQMVGVRPVYTDDVAVRIDFFSRLFPLKSYAAQAMKAADAERAAPTKSSSTATKGGSDPATIEAFITKANAQLVEDEARIRDIQNPDGTWGFNPGKLSTKDKLWVRGDTTADPSPTALCITALTSLGHGKDDPTTAKGVKALLEMQQPCGLWNKAALTGFVSSAYAMHALSRLYPEDKVELHRVDFLPKPNESFTAALHRIQAVALTGDPQFTDLLLPAAKHASPQVRYWAMIGLGGSHTSQGVPVLINALSDRVKMVRDAATWSLRQTLLDDKGWDAVFNANEKGNDDTRAQVMQTLGMRADAVMTQAGVNWTRLGALFDKAINRDPHPAVRAWASKAAWQWWVWNPPIRQSINTAWLTMLDREESNALVENSNRYSSQALFIVNGHKANGSKEHQYKELATLFEAITKKLDAPGNEETKLRLASRLVGIGGTFFQTSGGDGGPGQMGYITPGSDEMMGKAALLYLGKTSKGTNLAAIRAGLEGGSNVPYQPLTAYLVDYSLKGPEELRQLAASAVSDPRSVTLPAVPELVQPQLNQIMRGALEPPRRAQLSDPILELWSKVNWNIPKTHDQQKDFFDLIIPRLDHYQSPAQIAGISDPAKRALAQRDMDADWYLADKLGEVMQNNPDLHLDIVLLKYFPTGNMNPLEERYWVRNVEWMLTFNPSLMTKLLGGKTASTASGSSSLQLTSQTGTPQTPSAQPPVKQPTPPSQPDPVDTVKDRVLQLYLDQLKPSADPKTRGIAIRMANQTALRTNPEVLRALEEALKTETTLELRSIITHALQQSNAKFLPELMTALKEEKNPGVAIDAKGNPALTKDQQEDIVYFRDYVMPELNRQKRTDQQACMGCHGVPGRVPSMGLHAPDKYGYTSVADLLYNYRTLQQRVSLTDLEKSKLLRKPLNIQDGKEDGHQGGRRYSPTDPGYLVIRHWAENQLIIQKPKEEKKVTLIDSILGWKTNLAGIKRRKPEFNHRS